MKAHAEKLKLSLYSEAPKAIKRARHKASCLIEKNTSRFAHVDVVSNVEDNIGIATWNYSMISYRQSPRIGSDDPVALDELF